MKKNLAIGKLSSKFDQVLQKYYEYTSRMQDSLQKALDRYKYHKDCLTSNFT